MTKQQTILSIAFGVVYITVGISMEYFFEIKKPIAYTFVFTLIGFIWGTLNEKL
jgi:ABC-type Mn2+/Zn2+ transport system permease subunit